MHTCNTCERAIDFNARDSHPAPGGGYVHRDGHACSRARRVAWWEFEDYYRNRIGGTPRRRPRQRNLDDVDADALSAA